MDKVRSEKLTRGNVIQFGFIVLALGGVGYGLFRVFGFDAQSAGIAAEATLVIGVLIWTASYLLRVVTGKMTFIEQRKRYIEAYEELTTSELQERFESMSKEEQMRLIEEIETEKISSDESSV